VLALGPLLGGESSTLAAGMRLTVLSLVGGVAYVAGIGALWFAAGRSQGPEAATVAFLKARMQRGS
jgi:formate hydrogenlyase subunit 3/multisubunit Na+/H+ antiporter MnhD subunit